MVIVQVSYNYSEDPETWAKAYTAERARLLVYLLGFYGMIWLDVREERRTGGIYCFRDRASAEAYVNGPLLGRHRANPALSNLTVTVSDTRDEMGRITRAPTRSLAGV